MYKRVVCQKKGQIYSSAELHCVFWQGGLAEQREAPVHNVEEEEDQGEGQSVRIWTFHRDCCSYKCWWFFCYFWSSFGKKWSCC